MDHTLRLALIGAGRMGRIHGLSAGSVTNLKITWVCDLDSEAAQRLASELGAQYTDSVDQVLNRSDVDAVIITTPTPTHAHLIELSAAAGKAIFVEKPITDTLDSARRATAAVHSAGVACQVGFQRRFDPAFVTAKTRIDRGELGKLEGLRTVARDPQPPPLDFLKSSGGIMVDLAIHDLDAARYLLGEVAAVTCRGGALSDPELARHGLFDTAVALLEFDNGALGTLEAALRTAYGYEARTEVLGAKGRIHIEMPMRHNLVQYGERGGRVELPQDFQERFDRALVNQLRAFADRVQAKLPVTPGPEDATKTLELALAAQQALESGERVGLDAYRATSSS